MTSPNGEDYLYVFFNRMSGLYALMPYRLIEQEISNVLPAMDFRCFRMVTW